MLRVRRMRIAEKIFAHDLLNLAALLRGNRLRVGGSSRRRSKRRGHQHRGNGSETSVQLLCQEVSRIASQSRHLNSNNDNRHDDRRDV